MTVKFRFPALLSFSLIMSLFLAPACRSAKKYVERGDYDSAIKYCVNKLSGKKKKDDDLVRGLELALAKANDRDMRTIAQLQAETHPENWERTYNLYCDIRDRQEKIEPLLPLTSSKGYRAKFSFVKAEKMVVETKPKAAEYRYSVAEDLLVQARKGDKKAARKAYDELSYIQRYFFGNYKSADEWKREAKDLGTTHILFEIKNQSPVILPAEFSNDLLRIGKAELDSEWKSFHTDKNESVDFDYAVVFKIRDIDVSPERVHERSFSEEKQIQDGWIYTYDKYGNVQKDSCGNDIKKPRYIAVKADILENHQSKAAKIEGRIEVLNFDSNQLMDSQNIGTEVIFENYAATFMGDKRALSPETKARIGNRPVPFPADESMLMDAAERLKPDVRNVLCRVCTD